MSDSVPLHLAAKEIDNSTKPAMKATAEELANRPVATCPPGQTLRLRPHQSMTLPLGQEIPKFKDTYTKTLTMVTVGGSILGLHLEI